MRVLVGCCLLQAPGHVLSEGILHGSYNVWDYLLARVSVPKIQNSAETTSLPKNARRTEALPSVRRLPYKHEAMSLLDTQNPGKSQPW